MGSRSSTQTSVPAWALPYAQSLTSTGQRVAAPGTPGTENAFNLAAMPAGMNQQVAGFTPDQLAGMQAGRAAAVGSAGLANAGADQWQRTMQGDYLSPESNPWLSSTYGAAADAMTNQYQQTIAPSQMADAMKAGVMGGSAQQEGQQYNQFQLSQSLGDLAAKIYGGNYDAERGRQVQTGSMLPQMQSALAQPGQALGAIGTLEQGQQQTELDAARGNVEMQTEYPYKIMSYLGNLLGVATGGGGSVTAGTSK